MSNSTLVDQTFQRTGLTSRIVIGLVAGTVCGLFFGELTEPIKWVGDAYVGLLQMAVLPYVATSLVAYVGRLSIGSSLHLLRVSLCVMGLLCVIGLLSLLVVGQAFPTWESGSFFSTRFTEEPEPPNWLDLFIPSNPFRALSENSIPAVVVFCMGLGVALMGLPNKEKLLDPLDVLVDGLANLNKLVVKLTPVGMFAIVAHTAGTVGVEQFSLVRGYLLSYGSASLILSFFVLPAVIASVTPLRFWSIVGAAREPLVAAFVIGNSFVVMPMMIDAVKRLQAEQDVGVDADSHDAEYLIPLAYPFPDVGRIVGLVFLPFAAWFYGQTIDWDMYPALLGVGLPGAFAKPVITIPLLLEIAELPSDIFNMWLASGVVAARFGDLMKTMHLMTFSILTTCILHGTARFRPLRLLLGLGISVLVLGLATLAIREYLSRQFRDYYSKEELVTERKMVFSDANPIDPIDVVVLDEAEPNPIPILPGQSRVQRIWDHGKIRIGFDPDKMPFCYFLADGKTLVGFDVQMGYYLANDLHVGIEFVPIQRGRLSDQLAADHFDVAMSALEGTMKRAALIPSMDPYMEVTLAIVVPDHKRAEFSDIDKILAIPNLKLALMRGSLFQERARRVLPSHVKIIAIDSVAEYFNGKHREIDGLVMSAESASAWTVREPGFSVTNPLNGKIRLPLYYMTGSDIEFENFLQNWLTLRRADGTYREVYDYWILGLEEESAKPPRWCILRDVLGWIR